MDLQKDQGKNRTIVISSFGGENVVMEETH